VATNAGANRTKLFFDTKSDINMITNVYIIPTFILLIFSILDRHHTHLNYILHGCVRLLWV